MWGSALRFQSVDTTVVTTAFKRHAIQVICAVCSAVPLSKITSDTAGLRAVEGDSRYYISPTKWPLEEDLSINRQC